MPTCQYTSEYVPGETELWRRGEALEALLGQTVLSFCEKQWLFTGWDVRKNEEATFIYIRQLVSLGPSQNLVEVQLT